MDHEIEKNKNVQLDETDGQNDDQRIGSSVEYKYYLVKKIFSSCKNGRIFRFDAVF